MSVVSRGRYKDQDAVVLDNGKLRAVILPAWGAKTISLVHTGIGVETLWQNPSPAFARSGYGEPYDKGEFAGFDEMFPTISRCFYESPPWAGVGLPDHGEVWTVPWKQTVEPDSVTLKVNGTRLPYTLKKTVSLEGERLVMRYVAANQSDFPLDFIWAAHPLFNASEGMRFIVPAGMDKIINAVPGEVLGGYGERYDFPLAKRPDGKGIRLDTVPRRNDRGYQKYYFAARVSEGWCMLRDDSKRLTIGLSYPAEKVPYLGMWLNEGGLAGQYNIAPEPATAGMDRIDFARMWGMGSQLAPGATYEWHLVISVAEGKEPRGVTPRGEFTY